MAKGSRHWGDRAAELAGAVALGIGAAASVWQLAPLAGVEPTLLAGAAGFAGVMIGWLIVRLTPDSRACAALAPFEVEPIETIDADDPTADELMLTEVARPARQSRVVELFEPVNPETPGELQARIAAHLGDGLRPARTSESTMAWNGSLVIPDASDALHAALAEIRRSLRAG